MDEAARFAFRVRDPSRPDASNLPYLPLTLRHGDRSTEVLGLLDTGSSVSVLPFGLGLELGAVWTPDAPALDLTGNLARFEARPLLATAQIAHFAPVKLAFAWTKSEDVPVLLGQVNFFMEFDVCFYRSLGSFEIRPKR